MHIITFFVLISVPIHYTEQTRLKPLHKNTHLSPILLQTFSGQLAIDNCFMFHILSLMSRYKFSLSLILLFVSPYLIGQSGFLAGYYFYQFFIFFFREQECYRCLVLNPWHQNVIQYKESEWHLNYNFY